MLKVERLNRHKVQLDDCESSSTAILFAFLFPIDVFLSVFHHCYHLMLGVVSNPMMQQPVMSGGLEVASPITFPEDHDDPRVVQNNAAGGGIWGFIKV